MHFDFAQCDNKGLLSVIYLIIYFEANNLASSGVKLFTIA